MADLLPKPTILIHRISANRLSFTDRLTNRFNLLDPQVASAAELRRVLGLRAADIRLVILVAPATFDADHLSCLPSLECLLLTSAGFDRIDLAQCRRRGITVANNHGSYSEDVADYAVGLFIDVLRNVSAGNHFVRAKSWSAIGDFHLGSKIKGKRVGIVGLGGIGTLVAKRLVAFGCIVAYNSRTKKPSSPYPYYDNVLNLAQESDALVLCCSLTDQTRHIVDKEVMAALGARGVIINVGRGPLIDEKEMVRLLVEGQLGGAGLDVFENEPNVPHELFGLDNVVLSTHVAIYTPESFKASTDVVVANVEAFYANKPLLSIV